MRIEEHGTWSLYTPDPYPAGLPAGIIFAENPDRADWYDYSRAPESFSEGSVKLMVLEEGDEWIVKVATRDESALFPAGFRVISVIDQSQDDLASKYVGKVLNDAGEFVERSPRQVVSVPASSAKLVLDDDGIYGVVENTCLNHPVLAVRIYWSTAATWERYNPYVLAIGAEMHLSEEQMNEMFNRARLK